VNSPKYSFGAYWGARAEDTRACGARLAIMLRELAKTHPAFTQWYELGDGLPNSYRSFCTMPPQLDELEKQFARNRKEPVLGRDNGFSLSAWNGRQDDYGINFEISVGDGTNWGNARPFVNRVTMDLPRWTDETADMISTAGMRAMLLAVVAGWEPDTAEVMDWSQLKLPPGQHLPPFRTGWLSYVGPRYAPHVLPSPDTIMEKLAGGGLLMLATREPFDIANPTHAAAAERILRALDPVQPLAGTLPTSPPQSDSATPRSP